MKQFFKVQLNQFFNPCIKWLFLLEDPNWINSAWKRNNCIDIMKATDFELNKHQLCAGLSGFNKY